jgi:heme exporter protein C
MTEPQQKRALDRVRAAATVRRGLIITSIALAGLAATIVMVQLYAPTEASQGLAQKIFYLHAPTAWSTLLAFSLCGLAGGLYLWLRDPRLDVFAEASAEVGLVFSAMMLSTGPLWGKPIWGTWWQWEPRLTLTLLEVFLFIGYRALRGAISDPSERARYSAIVGLLGLALVPFVHLSVYLFRTIHPQPIILKPSAPSLPSDMLLTLFVSLGVFTVLYLGFVTARYGLGLLRATGRTEHAD